MPIWPLLSPECSYLGVPTVGGARSRYWEEYARPFSTKKYKILLYRIHMESLTLIQMLFMIRDGVVYHSLRLLILSQCGVPLQLRRNYEPTHWFDWFDSIAGIPLFTFLLGDCSLDPYYVGLDGRVWSSILIHLFRFRRFLGWASFVISLF